MVEYTATTSNATNKVTATATDPAAEITILLGETEIQNGSNASWELGEKVTKITGPAPEGWMAVKGGFVRAEYLK